MNLDKDKFKSSSQKDHSDYSRIPISEISSSQDKIYSKTGKLIKIIDDLKDCGVVEIDFHLRLPMIFLIGRPSSGKSSIANSLIGIDLLPRGDSIVTRCPIELRMKHIHNSTKIKPYCEIYLDGVSKEGRYENFLQAKQILLDYMKNKSDYSQEPVKINFYSNSCADVTIVDLPGISDSNRITRDIACNYLRDEASIILYSIDASDEDAQINLLSSMKNETIMSLIEVVDDELTRTIGIFTKIDNINYSNPNSNELFQKLKKYMTNEIEQDEISSKRQLKHGYVAVKNLSANDKSTQIADNSHIEREYFRAHNSFKFSPSDQTSVEALAEKLKKIFYSDKTVTNNIVKVHTQLKDTTQSCQNELSKFGIDYLIYTSESKHTYIASLINIFSDDLEKIFSSKMSRIEDNLMNHKLKEMYAKFLKQYTENYNPSSNMQNEEIIRIIKITEGDKLSGFPEADVVCSLLVDETENLRDEVKVYMEEVNELILGVVKDTTFKIFCRFPKLMDKIEELMNIFCKEKSDKMKYIIESIAEMNFKYLYLDEKCLSYHNLLEKFVISNDESGNCVHGRGRSDTLANRRLVASTDQNSRDVDGYYNGLAEYIKILINHFYSIMIRNLRESVPKATGNYFLNILKNETRFYLLKELTSDISTYEFYLEEDHDVMERRNYYINLMKTLKNCDKMLLYEEDVRFVIKGDRRKSINTILEKGKKQNSSSIEANSEYSQNNRSIMTSNKENVYEVDQNKSTLSNPQTARKFFTDEAEDNKGNQSKLLSNNSNYSSNTNNVNLKQTSNHTTNNNYINLNNSNQAKIVANPNQSRNEIFTDKPEKNISNKDTGNISIKLDPTGDIKDAKLKVDLDAETAWNFYQNNKKYLPSTQQVISGAKATANFVEKTGSKFNEYDGEDRAIINSEKDVLVTGNKISQNKKATDPLTMANLFGIKKDSNQTANKSTAADKNPKKGFF